MLVSALLCGLVLSVPALLVDFPVSTDLPQHLAQVRLFIDALQQPDGPYAIQWLTPYMLGYLPTALAWLLATPERAGSLAVVFAAMLWSGTAHALAARAGRGPASGVLACVPFFGGPLQWGLLPFAVGFTTFAVFLDALLRAVAEPRRAWRWSAVMLAAFAVYWTHLLWFGAAMVAAALVAVEHKAWRYTPQALAALAPAAGLAAWSTLHVHETFGNGLLWGTPFLTRLHPMLWAAQTIGPSKDVVPSLVLFGVLGLLAWGLAHMRGGLDRHARLCLGLAAVFTAFTLFFPVRYTNTVQFNSRWASPALVFLVLGVPLAGMGRRVGLLAASCLLVVSTADVSAAWRFVNRQELAGLPEALQSLPRQSRVLGLNYQGESRYVFGEPFIQTFAWAQVRHGGELGFSFADFSVMPVVYRESRRGRWTEGLEWYPQWARDTDLAHFDYLLVSGDDATHARVQQQWPGLMALTSTGVWRSYRIAP